MRPVLLCLAFALLPVSALAEEQTVTEARRAQLESLRAQVAAQIQLQAYDLLDELVFSWIEQPVFALETPVVLADVSVPVGFGSGLQALIENHFASLVVKNPRTRVILAHCPQCTSVVVHSGAKGTIISRGVDEPEALSTAGALSGSRHALFLDFEVEGAALVLRARITALEPALPIVYAKTLSTSTSSPALLRTADRLKSASEARQEYLDTLRGRSVYLVPVRFGVRSYAPGSGSVMVAPFLWLQAGAEAPLTQARAWTGSLMLGASWMPQRHVGVMVQGRISRLLSGSVTSLTRPDLYGFVGGSVTSIHGLSALVFKDRVPNLEDLATELLKGQPHALFGTLQLGLELRVKNRIGASVFVESLPSMNNAPSIGRYVNLGPIQVHALGVEVSFCF
ncbi:hypothetical protein JQX13_37060 [Archangium violaceum]|uniref:hypothetical protein n=1 Tax=Archangium violaceum TaxID=83451 RepID=UPI00193BA1BF|nr:hypothetical protein [Archangium violaceum]QRK05718.1 hypothetical protein JQX13_37060 [Archangium violaceum]